jgi:hypothetical protein
MRAAHAQVSTRSGRAGTKDARPIVHGTYNLATRGHLALMRTQLADLMHAAQQVAREGIVTEVAVLVYDPAAAATILADAEH